MLAASVFGYWHRQMETTLKMNSPRWPFGRSVQVASRRLSGLKATFSTPWSSGRRSCKKPVAASQTEASEPPAMAKSHLSGLNASAVISLS
jgi:hypothetical protein